MQNELALDIFQNLDGFSLYKKQIDWMGAGGGGGGGGGAGCKKHQCLV